MTQLHTQTHNFAFSFLTLVYYRILNIIPVLYSRTLFFIYCLYNCLSANPTPPIHPSPAPSPLAATDCSLRLWVCLCLTDRLTCVICYLPHESVIMQYFSFSFWLTLLSMRISKSIHVAANGIISFFLWLSNIPLYICIISLSIYLPIDI